MSRRLRVCVIVPVRNEAATIGDAIRALARQTGIERSEYEIIMLANNCEDDSAAIVRAEGRRHPGLRLDVIERDFPNERANVGHARRLLMDEAARRLASGGVVASTDGDTVVGVDWLASILREIDAGADMVGGRLLARWRAGEEPDPATRRCHLNDTVYRLLMAEVADLIDPEPADPWPRHFQHFGASLAITADAYRAVGGLPRVDCLEDVALYEAMRRMDARIRHSFDVRAVTSGRMGGRVRIGFSTQLGEWRELKQAGQTRFVESAPYVIERLQARRRLREIWTESSLWKTGLAFGRFFDQEMLEFQSSVHRLEPVGAAIDGLRDARVRLRAQGPARALSAPLEEIEPIRFGAVASHMAQRSARLSVG